MAGAVHDPVARYWTARPANDVATGQNCTAFTPMTADYREELDARAAVAGSLTPIFRAGSEFEEGRLRRGLTRPAGSTSVACES